MNITTTMPMIWMARCMNTGSIATMSELMLRALLAGSGVGALAAMLGCFVVWRRMSYVGDAMGHAALTGVVLGLLAGVNTLFTVLATAALVGLLLVRMHRDKRLPFDALLAMVSTGGLSIGLSLFALLPNKQVDLNGYLFGDVLAVSPSQLWLLYGLLVAQS
ncbi:MAG: metal ABC transporter permease, partial [Alphaproteobacteria bacterium]|nr:metal ABC transporter permease [Alphaproteobacteria bacterium]